MAQLFTDFSNYTADAQPSDWTERWNTGAAASNVRDSGIPGTPSVGGSHALEVVFSADFQEYALSWDKAGDVTGDVQILVLAYYEHTSNRDGVLAAYVHGSFDGDEGDDENAYHAEMEFTESTETYLRRRLNGFLYVGGSADLGLTRNQWVWYRLDRSGTDLRLKAWADGDPEPGSWSISDTDSSFTHGWVGLGARADEGKNWFAQIGVGTGGDEAPAEAVMGIDSVTPSSFADSDTGVTIAGSGFEASQGTGKVELGDSSDYGTATLVEQTVTSWSDTSIEFTVDQGALDYGSVWVFVTNDGGSTTSGFECTIPVEGQGDLTVPMLSLSADGVQTFKGTSDLIIPSPNMEAQGQASEPIGTGLLTIPMVQLEAQGEAPPIAGAGDLVVPMLAMEAAGKELYVSTSELTLFPIALQGAGLETYPGVSQILVPLVEFQAAGGQFFIGTSNLTLPFITLTSLAGVRDQTFTINAQVQVPRYRGSLIVPTYQATRRLKW